MYYIVPEGIWTDISPPLGGQSCLKLPLKQPSNGCNSQWVEGHGGCEGDERGKDSTTVQPALQGGREEHSMAGLGGEDGQ